MRIRRCATTLASAVALGIGAASDRADAQIINEPAPAGNVQALAFTGSSNEGEVIHLAVDTLPNSAAYVFFSVAIDQKPHGSSWFLLDFLYGLPFPIYVPLDPNGHGQLQAALPSFEPGLVVYGQAFIKPPSGNILFSNRAGFSVTGLDVGVIAQLDLDPVTSPTAATTVTISGKATYPNAPIKIEGGTSTVNVTAGGAAQQHAFSALVSLKPNFVSTLIVNQAAGTAGAAVSEPVIITHDSEAPTVFIDSPDSDAMPNSNTVVVAGRVADRLSGFLGLEVKVNGFLAAIETGLGTNATFAAEIPLNGDYLPTTITAVAKDALGNTAIDVISVTKVPLIGDHVLMISGDKQKAPIQTLLLQPIVVRVRHADGSPFPNKLVTFTVSKSDGRLSTTPAIGGHTTEGSVALQALSDSQGYAQCYWRLGGDAGCGNNRVLVTSEGLNGLVEFCASALPGPVKKLNIGSGNDQYGAAGSELAEPLSVWVNDGCNGIADVPVTFVVTSGDAFLRTDSAGPSTALTVMTDLTGHASVGCVVGVSPVLHQVQARLPWYPEHNPAVFQARSLLGTPGNPTRFLGVVRDNAERPIQGATCRLVFKDNTIYTTSTDIDGKYVFDALPQNGSADFHVDGTTAFFVGGINGVSVLPNTFPKLRYRAPIVANVDNFMTAPVMLPELDPRNKFLYSTTQDTVLTVAGIAGLEMRVKAGSMKLPTGQPTPNGTVITLNAVHSDNVPMPMPNGAAPPFSWTLQPGGSTFDPPIEVRYPNMSGLAPNAAAYFLVFDHDIERFEIVATGSATADGKFIVTNEGSGISKAGWGCQCPPYAANCGCGPCEKKGCKSNGSVSTPTIEVTELTNSIKFHASGASDSGGEKWACKPPTKDCPIPEQASEVIPAVNVSYKYEVIPPNGMKFNGSGQTVTVPKVDCGSYTVIFKAEANRSCPPSSSQPAVAGWSSPSLSTKAATWGVDLKPVLNKLTSALSLASQGKIDIDLEGQVAFQGSAKKVCCPQTPTNAKWSASGTVSGSVEVKQSLQIPVPYLSIVIPPIEDAFGVVVNTSVSAGLSGLSGSATFDCCTQALTIGGTAVLGVTGSAETAVQLPNPVEPGNPIFKAALGGSIQGGLSIDLLADGVLIAANGKLFIGKIELQGGYTIDPPGSLYPVISDTTSIVLDEGVVVGPVEVILAGGVELLDGSCE